MLGYAAASTVWANLSDIWGRKPILLSALVLFFGSSIICATAVNMPMLIAGRAIQGTAGGGMLQMVNIIISDIFSVRYVCYPLQFCISIIAHQLHISMPPFSKFSGIN